MPRLVPFLAIVGLSLGCAREPAPPASPRGQWADPRYPTTGSPGTEFGLATYYADSLAGHLTASGEPYDPRALTAAHRTLPFGTVVDVIRADDGRSVRVRINDRGPFTAGRVIDLSRAAAEQLDMIRAGVVQVRVVIVSMPTAR